MRKFMEEMRVARKAVIEDLTRRNGAASEKGLESGFDCPPKTIGGSGEIDCPVCGKAKLRYSRAASNGHVHAACANPECVRWME